jgi:hypothetical protein
MSTTAAAIGKAGLGKLGVVSPGEALRAADGDLVLSTLNRILDAWKLEKLYAYATETITHTTAGETATLTIGPTGDIDVPERPTRFEPGCFYRASNVDYQLHKINEAEFNRIIYKAVTAIGDTSFQYDAGLPLGRLQFYPRLPAGVALNLLVQKRLDEFATLTTAYTLPPGYERALVFTLAEEVAADYEREIPPTVARNAAAARRILKRSNFSVPQLQVSQTNPLLDRARLFGS